MFFFIIIFFKVQKIEEEERRNKRNGVNAVDCEIDHFILGNLSNQDQGLVIDEDQRGKMAPRRDSEKCRLLSLIKPVIYQLCKF